MADPLIEHRCASATGGCRILTGLCELTPEPETTFCSNAPYPNLLWEEDTNQTTAVHLETLSRVWRSAESPSPYAADASAKSHAAPGMPNPSLQTSRCWPWPPTDPTGPTCLVDADSELALALAADPFHLDWPHW